MFGLGLLGLNQSAEAQTGGTNSVTCEAWFAAPAMGTIKLVYYGKWSIDSKNWTHDHVRTDYGQFVKGVWVPVPASELNHGLLVDAMNPEIGTYGLPKGGVPGPNTKSSDIAYVKGATFNVRAQLFAKPAGMPGAQPVAVASSIQTLTMP